MTEKILTTADIDAIIDRMARSSIPNMIAERLAGILGVKIMSEDIIKERERDSKRNAAL